MERELFERLLDNEKEWRKHMLEQQTRQSEQLEKVSKEMSNLKIKVAGISGLFGLIGAYVKSKIHL